MYPDTRIPGPGFTARQALHPAQEWLAVVDPQQLLTGTDKPLLVGPAGHAFSGQPARTLVAYWDGLAKTARDPKPHKRLPEGFMVAEAHPRGEIVLLDPQGRAAGYFDPRTETQRGQFLELREEFRGKGLGAAFMVCALERRHDRIDIAENHSTARVMEQVLQPANLNDAGIHTLLAAKNIARREALAMGNDGQRLPDHGHVVPVRQLDPRPVPVPQLLRSVVYAAHTMPIVQRDESCLEIMATAKLLAPDAVKLYRLVDRDAPMERPQAFMMKVNGDFYFGHLKAEDSKAGAALVERLTTPPPRNLAWMPAKLEQLMSHPGLDRTKTHRLLNHAEGNRLRELGKEDYSRPDRSSGGR